MRQESREKTTITLPSALYHKLRNEAHRKGLSLPEFIQHKVKLEPSAPTPLAKLPLKQIIRQTSPGQSSPDARLDFFSQGGC